MLYDDMYVEERLLFPLLPFVPSCFYFVAIATEVLMSQTGLQNWCSKLASFARMLLEINECGNYINPGESSSVAERLLHQDEEIFQIMCLINSTWFVSVVFSDYLNTGFGKGRKFVDFASGWGE
jgi:hypothetical protein